MILLFKFPITCVTVLSGLTNLAIYMYGLQYDDSAFVLVFMLVSMLLSVVPATIEWGLLAINNEITPYYLYSLIYVFGVTLSLVLDSLIRKLMAR